MENGRREEYTGDEFYTMANNCYINASFSHQTHPVA